MAGSARQREVTTLPPRSPAAARLDSSPPREDNVETNLVKLMHIATLAATLFAAPAFALTQDGTPTNPPAAENAALHDSWNADFDVAAKLAKEQGKDLLVDFTGSDWCGWCKKLDAEVFSHAAFLDAVQKEYVLVALDFPHAEEVLAKVPNRARNVELQKQHKVRGFPTVLLMTAAGDVFGRTGYQAGGPEKYVAALATMRSDGKKQLAEILESAAKLAAAADGEKLALLDAAIAKLAGLPLGSPFAERWGVIVAGAFDAVGDDAQARKLAALDALLDAAIANDAILAAARALDAKNEAGHLERAIAVRCGSVASEADIGAAVKLIDELDAAGPIKDAAIAKTLFANCAFWNFRFLENVDAAKKYAQKVKDLNPEEPQLQQLIATILGS